MHKLLKNKLTEIIVIFLIVLILSNMLIIIYSIANDNTQRLRTKCRQC